MVDPIAKTTQKILQCDEPSPYTGRVYPREEIEKAVANYQTKIDEGVAYGTLCVGDDLHPVIIEIDKISHKVTSIAINERGEVIAEIEMLDTSCGQQAVSLMSSGLRLSPSMIGRPDFDNIVHDVEIFQTTWLPDPAETE